MNFKIKDGKVHQLVWHDVDLAYEYVVCGLHFLRVRKPVNKRTSKPVTCKTCLRIIEGRAKDD